MWYVRKGKLVRKYMRGWMGLVQSYIVSDRMRVDNWKGERERELTIKISEGTMRGVRSDHGVFGVWKWGM